MNPRQILTALLAIAIAFTLGIWWFADQAVTHPANAATDTSTDHAAPSPTAAKAAARSVANDEPAAVDETPAPDRTVAEPDPSALTGPVAIVRGRCVDADGQPLADTLVDLHGWGANQGRKDEWLRDHDEMPAWEDPTAITTASDGRFEFRFWPPPPFQFALDVRRRGCGALSARWGRLEPGSTTDLGDIAVTPGVRVRGHVVETSGAALAETTVTFSHTGDSSPITGEIRPRWGSQTRTSPNGAFEMRGWLTPGTYTIRVRDRELVDEAPIELKASEPEADVRVVVKPMTEVDTISGRVVDQRGQPVPRARIQGHSTNGAWLHGSSKRDGTFALRLRTNSGTAGKITLNVDADGFEPLTTAAEYEVNQQGIELRLSPAATLTIRITDPDDAPIDRYSVRLIPRGRNRFSSQDAEVKATGPYEDGTAKVAGLTAGSWLLFIDFPASAQFELLTEEFTLDATRDTRLDLRASRTIARTLRLRTPNGEPVADARVILCETFGGGFGPRRYVMERSHWLINSQNDNIMVLANGTTDSKGEYVLRGPGSRPVGVQLPGPGHVAQEFEAVRLDESTDFVVTVDPGAELLARVTSTEVLDEIRRLAKTAAGQPFEDRRKPTLQLKRGDETYPPPETGQITDRGTRIREDDTFVLSGAPPGEWDVVVNAVGVRESTRVTYPIAAGTVTLRSGQRTEIDLDLAAILPGTLEGVVTLNGAPWANDRVLLDGDRGSEVAKTDAEGRFTLQTRPGTYPLRIGRSVGDRWISFKSMATVTIVRGQTTRQTFEITTGSLRLEVSGPDGKPVAGLSVQLEPGGDSLPPTDEAGVTEQEVIARNVTLRTLPKRLMSNEAWRAAWQEGRARGLEDPLGSHWVTIGTAAIAAGQTTTVPIRLPPEWAR